MTTRLSLWLFLCVALAVLASAPAALAQGKPASKSKTKLPVTTVYLVRHAEKDTTGHAEDPLLSTAGQVRAQALRQVMLKRHPAALFTTDTKRARATLAPLAEATKLEPQVYDARRTYLLAERIRKEYPGKTVVVVGHSNTLLPFIDELGGTAPVDEIKDDEYEYLFTVRMMEGAPSTVGVGGYGPERKGSAASKAAAGR